jgi:hypothetical protein
MSGQIVDATVVQARRPRLTEDEKATVKGGAVPEAWSKAKRAQMDTDGRWTIKRGRRRPPGEGAPQARGAAEIAVPVFGYKNHLGIDRRHGFIRTFTVTDAASRDGRQLDELLDPHNTASSVWPDTAYRSAANGALLARRGLAPQFQRPKPRGKPMSAHVARATPAGRGSRSRSSTSSPPRNAASVSSCARSVWPAPRPSSGSPTWSPTCAVWSGSKPGRHRPEGRAPATQPGAPRFPPFTSPPPDIPDHPS